MLYISPKVPIPSEINNQSNEQNKPPSSSNDKNLFFEFFKNFSQNLRNHQHIKNPNS